MPGPLDRLSHQGATRSLLLTRHAQSGKSSKSRTSPTRTTGERAISLQFPVYAVALAETGINSNGG
eukprot:3850474-Prymnesium_polylepis.1